jgi:hypothetical protein
VRRHRGLAEALRSFPLKEALDLEAVGRYARTIGPPVWHNVEGMTARASSENLLLTGIESLPTNGAAPAGCMAMLSTVGEEWPTTIADVVRKVRQKGLDCCGCGWKLQWPKAHCPPRRTSMALVGSI